MKKEKYQNELLGQSKTDLKQMWDNLWDEYVVLDPMKDRDRVSELNKEFDKCKEAYYAVDCGKYWKVDSASRVRGRYMTYTVEK